MSQPIPPEIEAQITAGVIWLWSQYGQKALEKITGRVVDEAKWRWSIEKYYTSLYERVGFVRVLGRMEAEPLENVLKTESCCHRHMLPMRRLAYLPSSLMTKSIQRPFAASITEITVRPFGSPAS